MDTKAIDGYTRQDLWDRLEQADCFDWCRKEEYRQLSALYFDGVVEEFPKPFITCRELVWSPKTGQAQWQSVLDARSRYRQITTGEIHTDEHLGEEFAVEQINSLLIGYDEQHFGMAVDDQVALIEFLGVERLHARMACQHLDAWSCEMWLWLAGEAKGDYAIAGLADTRANRLRELFYRLLTEAPVAMKDGRLMPTEEQLGWSAYHAEDLHEGFKLLFKQIDNYRLPKALACDPGPRLQFIESMHNDLASDRAPLILREMWTLWQSRKAEAQAKAAAKKALKAQAR